jgi:hypothetical protein
MLQYISQGFVGFVGGLAALWAHQYFAWKPQKRIELRRAAFDEARTALAMYEVDAVDVELQANPQTHNGRRSIPVLRVETRVQMQKARSLVQAFFPNTTFDAFKDALQAQVSLENIPYHDFTEKTAKALKLMADDVGLGEPVWRQFVPRRWLRRL